MRRDVSKGAGDPFAAAAAEERERRRIAIGLHDSIGQSLALAEVRLKSVRADIAGRPRAAVDEAIELLNATAAEVRKLSFELSPPVLYDLGIDEALAWLAEDAERRYGIAVAFAGDPSDKPLDEVTAALVFRSVRELLANVFKHAKSASCTLSLGRVGDAFYVEVEDHGVGFDVAAVTDPAAPAGFGLLSVREQISRLGGRVEMVSASGQGARVRITVPLLADQDADAGKGKAI